MLSLALAAAAGAGVVWPNATAGMAIPITVASARDAIFTWNLRRVVCRLLDLTLAAFTILASHLVDLHAARFGIARRCPSFDEQRRLHVDIRLRYARSLKRIADRHGAVLRQILV